MTDRVKNLDFSAVEQRILAYMAAQPTRRYGGRFFEQPVDATKVAEAYRARFKNISDPWRKPE